MSTRTWPVAAPDGLIAAVLLSFMATAGLFYVNILPALVDGLKTGLHFTARDAGFVASANVYGAAIGAFAAVFTVRFAPWRKVALASLLTMIAIDIVSTQLHTPLELMAIRFVHGIVGGGLVGTSYGVFARTKAPDKVFGMLLVVQFGLGGVGLMVLPHLVALFGPAVLFLALATFSLSTLAMLPFLSSYERPPESTAAANLAVRRPQLIAALVAVLAFQAANEGLGAYVFGLGRTFGMATDAIAGILGISNWVGALGSVGVVIVGIRFGRMWPIIAGTGLAFAGTALFLVSGSVTAFAVANLASSVAWSFTIAYLLGLCAAFDRSGRSAALAGFSSKIGLASGPAIGAVVLGEVHYIRLILLACLGLAIAAVAAVWPAMVLDQQKTEA